MSIILFIIILSLLVFVHELGHFSSAKFFGIRVDEFALGFPPKIFSKKVGETTYAVNAIPIGGYVKIYGEDGDEEIKKDETSTEKIEIKKSRKMSDAPRWKQAIVLSSGVLGNIVFAWFLLSIGFMIGLPTSSGGPFSEKIKNQSLIITSILPDSPAEVAGLKAGDKITSISLGEKIITNPDGDSASSFISQAPANSKIEMAIQREDTPKIISATTKENIIPGRNGIGISMEYAGILRLYPHEALVAGTYATFSFTKSTAIGIFNLLVDALKGNASMASVTGPVGIAKMVGDAGQTGLINLLLLTVVISINLAIINLVPFPALDGGRLFFLFGEAIIRRPINSKITRLTNQFGFLLLLLFMAIITYKDIIKLIK